MERPSDDDDITFDNEARVNDVGVDAPDVRNRDVDEIDDEVDQTM